MPWLKFGENWTNGSGDIQICVIFKMAAVGHFDFSKNHNFAFGHFRGCERTLWLKFGENLTNGSGYIKIYVIFKMAAGGHLEFSKMSLFYIGSLRGPRMGAMVKIW